MPQGEAAGLRDAAERCCQAAPPARTAPSSQEQRAGGAPRWGDPAPGTLRGSRAQSRAQLFARARGSRAQRRAQLFARAAQRRVLPVLDGFAARVAGPCCSEALRQPVPIGGSARPRRTAHSGGASHRGCDMACSRLANTVVGFITPACQCPSQCAPRHIARGALLRAFKLRGGAVPLLRRRCMWLLRQVTSSHEQAWGTPARARGTPCHMQPQRSCTDAIGARRRIPNHAAGRTVVKGARLPKPALVHELACCRHRCPAAPMQPLSFPWCCHENGGTAPCTCTWPSCGGRST